MLDKTFRETFIGIPRGSGKTAFTGLRAALGTASTLAHPTLDTPFGTIIRESGTDRWAMFISRPNQFGRYAHVLFMDEIIGTTTGTIPEIHFHEWLIETDEDESVVDSFDRTVSGGWGT